MAIKSTHKKYLGLTKQTVIQISERKNEPGWMTDLRLRALEIFYKLPTPKWGPNLDELNIDDILFYIEPILTSKDSWDDIPDKIKTTFEKLGVPEAERKYLAGVGAQFESEMIYKNLKKEWLDKGVIFLDTETGLKNHPEIFKKFFASVIPAHDNKFAALNSAVWSGGNFVYIPKDLKMDQPLQAYFRIDSERMGQFERTLIIAEENSSVHYVEGCSAPKYQKNSLHSAVVEVIALNDSRVQYTTIQNWALNVYNLVTKRALAYSKASVSWIDGNFGSKITMKYPSVVLMGSKAHGEIMSIAFAGKNQIQDSGAKVIHLAPDTTSSIISKSISKDGGKSSYRGLVKIGKKGIGSKSKIQCDAMMLDQISESDTYPTINSVISKCQIEHEASVCTIDSELLFYLESRGLEKSKAQGLIVNGFIDPFIKTLPMEYAVELNRLIDLEMEDSLG